HEDLSAKRTNRTERMIRRNPSFQVHIAGQLCRLLVNSAHRTPSNSPISLANHRDTESHSNRRENRLFQQPASTIRGAYGTTWRVNVRHTRRFHDIDWLSRRPRRDSAAPVRRVE